MAADAHMIFHVTSRPTLERAKRSGTYRGDTLESEGFIHLCELEQLLPVAERYFRGVEDLVLLCVDPTRLSSCLVYEDSYGVGERFPHLYGPLELGAVVRVVDFPVRSDGTFVLPDDLPAPAHAR